MLISIPRGDDGLAWYEYLAISGHFFWGPLVLSLGATKKRLNIRFDHYSTAYSCDVACSVPRFVKAMGSPSVAGIGEGCELYQAILTRGTVIGCDSIVMV